MKYTKGPWMWQSFGCGALLVAQHGRREIVLGAIADMHGHCAPAMSMDGIMELVNPEHPNAKLITAAPEMLEALIQAKDVLFFTPDQEPLFLKIKQIIKDITEE